MQSKIGADNRSAVNQFWIFYQTLAKKIWTRLDKAGQGWRTSCHGQMKSCKRTSSSDLGHVIDLKRHVINLK